MLLNTILSRLIHDSLTSLALEQVCMMGRRLQCGKLTQRTLIHVLDYSIILRISIYHELVHETKENHVYKNERKHLYIHAQYTQTLHYRLETMRYTDIVQMDGTRGIGAPNPTHYNRYYVIHRQF